MNHRRLVQIVQMDIMDIYALSVIQIAIMRKQVNIHVQCVLKCILTH